MAPWILSNFVPWPRLCVPQGPYDMKKSLRQEEKQGGEMWVAGVFEAGPFMSAVIIVRLKVGHTLWACSHKEQECSHCAGRLAGWEYYGRAELCRARHGQELPWCLPAHSRRLCLYTLPHSMLIICSVGSSAVLGWTRGTEPSRAYLFGFIPFLLVFNFVNDKCISGWLKKTKKKQNTGSVITDVC